MKPEVRSLKSESHGAPTSGLACPGEQCRLHRVGDHPLLRSYGPIDRRSGLAGGISRRTAIRIGGGGMVGLAGAASLFDFFSKWRESEAPADIFKGDAPAGEVWELWQKRGWVKEASHYLKLGRSVQCKVCPNNCLLSPGDRSHCRNKVNHDGTLYTMVYGNPCTFHVDPVEKKPLFHFLPGSPTFSTGIFTRSVRILH